MGPLRGIKVIELAGLGPAPMAAMMLADMGAEVIRIERSFERLPEHIRDASYRGKKSVALNLKDPQGVEVFFKLVETSDVLIEPFRPGVVERLGIGPEPCMTRNPKLIYGRMTGWGQDGPLAKAAGHDINYAALSGAIFAIGHRGERPAIPLNLVGDMGGGGMLMAFGVVCALLEAKSSGKGQVIDAAMIDGAALLMWMIHSFHASGIWDASQRGVNMLDGGAHFYNTYETKDGAYVAIGPIEPQFYAELLERMGLDKARFADQNNRALWPEFQAELATAFKTKTQAEWRALLEGTDACFAPVLSILDAPKHPHHAARETYFSLDGFMQPVPAPRFSRTKPERPHGQRPLGADGEAVLAGIGFSAAEIAALRAKGVLFGGA